MFENNIILLYSKCKGNVWTVFQSLEEMDLAYGYDIRVKEENFMDELYKSIL